MFQAIDPATTTIFGLLCSLVGFALGALMARRWWHRRDSATPQRGVAASHVILEADSAVESSAFDPAGLAALLAVDGMVQEARRLAGDDPVKQAALGSILNDGVRNVRGILAEYQRGRER